MSKESETFVDFEHGLNTAARKLRQALCDEAETPQYIETLPRRGYRFLMEVEEAAHEPSRIPEESHAIRPVSPSAHPQRRRRWFSLEIMGIALAAAITVALTAWQKLGRRTAADAFAIHSLTVLPLENLSRNPDEEYFAEGLTDSLITDLGKIADLRLISRTSVLSYRSQSKSVPQIARELNVDAIVEGTVPRSGNRGRPEGFLRRKGPSY